MLDQQATLNKNGKRQNKFTKFLLKSWQPIPTWQSTIILFLIVGLALIGFGVALLIINRNIVEFSRQYDTDCTQVSCNLQFTISTAMSAPIFFYYEIDNFYQNHRRYINSVSSTQLAGNDISSSTASSDCTPIVTNADMGKTTSVTGAPLVATDVAVPCGLIAKSVFNDTYTLTDSSGKVVTITETGIAWPSDVNTKFKNSSNTAKQWHSMTDEHFIVWMRTAGLPDFRKLWGKINQDLPAGTYTLGIKNNYPVSGFNGKKYVVVSTTGPFGGKNNFLSISYLAVGGVCVLVSVFFFIRWRQFAKKTR